MPSAHNPVCVIIAAHDAESTIGRAVASALMEEEVCDVIVVDDRSSDATGEAARAADDGTRRLRIISCRENRGPAAARNRALSASTAPLVSILDADDFFVPGRFRSLLADDDWDMIADNVVFVSPQMAEATGPFRRFEPRPEFLDLARFIEGNISRRGLPRGETGFLKPVMRRSFLERHGLRYCESLRLGEDYDLYARALVEGARYKVVRQCGYVAVERPDSLSGRHRTEDLLRLYEADRDIMRTPGLDARARLALARHAGQLRGKHAHRRLLDLKRDGGMAAALGYLLTHPQRLPAVAGGLFSDKLEAVGSSLRARRTASRTPAGPRYLFQDGHSP